MSHKYLKFVVFLGFILNMTFRQDNNVDSTSSMKETAEGEEKQGTLTNQRAALGYTNPYNDMQSHKICLEKTNFVHNVHEQVYLERRVTS